MQIDKILNLTTLLFFFFSPHSSFISFSSQKSVSLQCASLSAEGRNGFCCGVCNVGCIQQCRTLACQGDIGTCDWLGAILSICGLYPHVYRIFMPVCAAWNCKLKNRAKCDIEMDGSFGVCVCAHIQLLGNIIFQT